MTMVITNFFLGTMGSLLIFLLMTYIHGEKRFSAPFFVVAIGLVCAVLSLLFDYTATWIVLGLFSVASVMEGY